MKREHLGLSANTAQGAGSGQRYGRDTGGQSGTDQQPVALLVPALHEALGLVAGRHEGQQALQGKMLPLATHIGTTQPACAITARLSTGAACWLAGN